jgi:hypothetical protein
MKMVKSLLLGSAASLAVASAGQAADLPVKAKPVEYVKVCSLYGAGFYYMPGTDICLKIGGYVRAEITWGGDGNFTQGPVQNNLNNRQTNNLAMRARAYITADAREQSGWGTIRAYVAVGLASTDVGNTLLPSFLGFNRAFIQWAGMTAGITQSFYDFYSSPAMSYRGFLAASDTGDPGWWVWGYTAQFGNGLAATLSAEQRRSTQICDPVTAGVVGTTQLGTSGLVGTGGAGAGACSLSGDLNAAAAANTNPLGYGGLQAPDVVGNIRIDQTWGSAQVMAAAHDVNAPYYSGFTFTPSVPTTAAIPSNDGPSNKWGFAVGAGLRLNFPMIAQGDYFQSQVNYTQGAPRYVDFTDNVPTLGFIRGNGMAYGLMSDCVYGQNGFASNGNNPTATGGTGCNLTTAWGVNVGYEHYWTPQFHESFVGNYAAFRYNGQANDILCTLEGFGAHGAAPGLGTNALAAGGCDNNWNIWTAATRFQYDVTKSFYIGVEALYQRYDTMSSPNGVIGPTIANNFQSATTSAGVTQATPLRDENNWAITVRAHKDFLP